jgi:hypothetical protein
MNEGEVSSVDSVMKCPICGGELTRGYVIAYRGFWWDTEKHTYIGEGERLGKYPALTNSNFPALRCCKCSIIIFDCEKKE